ncbi:MAG: hypothetical protein O2894_06265 [Planctomycetota bacterium]|nr:hypothetical protein [Planctomycetota bacterium]
MPARHAHLGLCACALLAAAAALAGCQRPAESSLPTVAASRLPVADRAGPWRPDEAHEEIGGPWRIAHGRFAPGDGGATSAAAGAVAVDPFENLAPVRPPPAPVRPAPTVAIPRRRGEEARPVGETTGKTAERLARDHFLDYPTLIRARSITLHLPPDLLAEARLRGAAITPPGVRRVATGAARLELRELTLEGERVTLALREDGLDDLQIVARGQVAFVADIRANILREEGLRGLLITNDRVAPLP